MPCRHLPCSRVRSWRESTPNARGLIARRGPVILLERALELVAQLVRNGDVRVGRALVRLVELRADFLVVLLEGAHRPRRARAISGHRGERHLAQLERREPGLAL